MTTPGHFTWSTAPTSHLVKQSVKHISELGDDDTSDDELGDADECDYSSLDSDSDKD